MLKILTISFVFTSAALFFTPQANSAELGIASNAKQVLLLDDSTNTILMQRQANEVMYPSSMSKLMTLYVLFEDLKNGSLKLDDTLPVSEKAWRKGGSKMFVKVDTRVSIEDLIRGIIIQSGNDACIVVAEGLSGSEEAFAKRMTEVGKKIGLKQSNFTNSTGWPDEKHVMSPADLATLSQRLIHDFPDYYAYFKEAEFTYSGITQPNRNVLLERDIGVDGLKTGHTEIAGYGIALSAKQNDRRLVLVINGLDSEAARAKEGETLLRHGFNRFQTHTLFEAGKSLVDIPVWMGNKSTVSAIVTSDAHITLPRDDSNIRFELIYNENVAAPISEGQKVGTIAVYNGDTSNNDTMIKTFQLVAAEPVAKAGVFSRIIQSGKYLLGL